MNKSVSPSRRYVAMCNKGNFDGYYFRSFTLPEVDRDGSEFKNTSTDASWYFMNRLDLMACIQGCVSEEDFKNVVEAESMWAARVRD